MALHKSAQVAIPIAQAQQQLGELARRVVEGREHVVLEQDGQPVMVLLSLQEYQALVQERERLETEQRVQMFREAARAIGEEIERQGLTEEQVMELLEQTREEVFQKHYGDLRRQP